MTKKIKILFTIPNFDTSGSGKSVYDMVKGLNRELFEPEVCCLHNRGELFKEMEKLNVKIHLFPFTATYRPFLTLPLRILKIYKYFKRHQFDIIHSWHWSSDFSESLAAKLAGIPFVYTKKAMSWGNKSWVWRSKLSTKIIAVNEDILPQFFSDMPDKIIQIPLCVDVNHFNPLPKSYISPEGITFKKEGFVILSVANLVAVKGIEILLESVKKLNDDSIKVLIVGDDNNDYGLTLKKEYKAYKNILFLGKHLDVRPYLALADVFVIPTLDEGRKEGLPIAPMEAMASARMVLGSDITGIREVLKAFPECLFHPSDINELASKIIWCKKKTIEERETIANEMRAYVEKELSISKFINEHDILYHNLINKY